MADQGYVNPAYTGQAVTSEPKPGYNSQYGNAPPPPVPHYTQAPLGQTQGPQGFTQQWMPRPETVPGCPPGLEYLLQVDQLLVQQQVEVLEVVTGWETQNKYQVKNTMGQQIFFAAEESSECMRQCCGPQRGFQMHVTDNFGKEVIQIQRPFKCCAGCSCCACLDGCAMEVEVHAPVGNVVGYVKQALSCLAPKYHILDATRNAVLSIEGPICICQGPCCPRDQEFTLYSATTGDEVGKISKKWSGLVQEMFTDADNFGVVFPQDLAVQMKATCLAAVFLIDFMFFEHNNDNN